MGLPAVLSTHDSAGKPGFRAYDATMITLLAFVPMMVAAAGWAFLYYLCGGGLGGAILLFIVLKMFGK